MAPIPLKKRKKAAAVPSSLPASECLFPDARVFLVERRMGSARRNFLTTLAQRKGFCVMSEYSDMVTHVVSEQNSHSEVLAWIEKHAGQSALSVNGPHLLEICWFTESMSSGKPVNVEPRHCLKDALEILAWSAFFQDSEARYLGFTRAASTLKALPFKLKSVDQAKDLPWCGGHSRTVIQEILEDGICREVEVIKNSEHYQAMKLLTGIYGVGVHTAERWFKEGIRKLTDLESMEWKITAEQAAGLKHYNDLQQPVTREEAERVEQLVKDAFQRFVPDVQITMTGGFRRGKPTGHDVDFLITHSSEHALTGLLENAVHWLDTKGLLLYHHFKKRRHAPRSLSSSMDNHETCYTICALPSSHPQTTDTGVKKCNAEDTDLIFHPPDSPTSRAWRAVRVDLVVTPHTEYAYALLGWTGSKHFERELRRYSLHEKKLSLSSHGLYDPDKGSLLPARTEEEIFSHLGLLYLPPSDRNA